jgi:hypothetical protein
LVLASASSSVAAVAFAAFYFMLGVFSTISRQRAPHIVLRLGEPALFPADVSFVTFVWLNKRAGHVTSLNTLSKQDNVKCQGNVPKRSHLLRASPLALSVY